MNTLIFNSLELSCFVLSVDPTEVVDDYELVLGLAGAPLSSCILSEMLNSASLSASFLLVCSFFSR